MNEPEVEIVETLRSLRPRQAPSSLDAPVLALASTMARSVRRRRVLRRVGLTAGLAAAATLVVAVLLRESPDRGEPDPLLASVGPFLSEGIAAMPEAAAAALAARTALLEVRLASLRRIAEAYPAEADRLQEIESLELELVILETLTPTPLEPGSDRASDAPEEGKNHESRHPHDSRRDGSGLAGRGPRPA